MKKFLEEFKAFAIRGNVMDMAVGVVIGGAFTAIITAIVEGLLTPILGLLLPNSTFAEWAPGGFGLGAVINAIIVFVLTALVVFLILKAVNKAASLAKKKEEEPAPVEEAPAAPTTEELLAQILEELKANK